MTRKIIPTYVLYLQYNNFYCELLLYFIKECIIYVLSASYFINASYL